jgi:hypothetical protein
MHPRPPPLRQSDVTLQLGASFFPAAVSGVLSGLSQVPTVLETPAVWEERRGGGPRKTSGGGGFNVVLVAGVGGGALLLAAVLGGFLYYRARTGGPRG